MKSNKYTFLGSLILLLVFVLSPLTVFAAIAFDAASSAQTGSNPSFTFVTSGTGRLLIVTSNTPSDCSSMSYDSVPLIEYITHVTGAGDHIAIWYLLNPDLGSHTLSIICSSGRLQAASYTGVYQSAFPDSSGFFVNQATIGAGNITSTMTTVNNDIWMVGTNDDTLLNPDVGVLLTTPRGGGSLGSGYLNDSNGVSITAGVNTYGYHYTGSNTTSVVAVAFSSSAPAGGGGGGFDIYLNDSNVYRRSVRLYSVWSGGVDSNMYFSFYWVYNEQHK